jgi:hypothetical protein
VRVFQFDLFDPTATKDAGEPEAVKRPRLSAGWQLANHACRFCFGRVLQRVAGGRVVEVRCAECGKSADGLPRMLCCCGAECGDLGYVLECVRNRNVTNEVPHEILVRERLVPVTTEVRPASRPVLEHGTSGREK